MFKKTFQSRLIFSICTSYAKQYLVIRHILKAIILSLSGLLYHPHANHSKTLTAFLISRYLFPTPAPPHPTFRLKLIYL